MSSTDIFRTKKRRFVFSSKLLWPVLVLAPLFLVVIVHRQFFTIKKVECLSGAKPCPESVANILFEINGRSLLLLNQRRLREALLATGLVGEVRFQSRIPGGLHVAITPPSVTFLVTGIFSSIAPTLTSLESTDSANLIPPSSELEAYVASISGKTFSLLSTGVLNQEEGQAPQYVIDSKIPSKEYLVEVFDWLTSLSESRIRPEALYFLPNMVVVSQKDQPDWLMNLNTSPREALLALQGLSQVVTIKKPLIIDFRFTNPILK